MKRNTPVNYQDEKNNFFYEENTKEILQGSHKIKTQTFFVIIDTMISDLTKRKIAYDKIYNKFDFLFNLGNLKSDDIEKKADHFQNIYCDDIEEDFVQEALQLSLIVNSIFPKSDESNQDKPNTQNLLTILRNKKLDGLFPNTEIALRLYYTLPISNCSGKRSFSALKRVKSYLRSTLSKEKLNSFAILNIENVLLVSMSWDKYIDQFAKQKSRKAFS